MKVDDHKKSLYLTSFCAMSSFEFYEKSSKDGHCKIICSICSCFGQHNFLQEDHPAFEAGGSSCKSFAFVCNFFYNNLSPRSILHQLIRSW